MATKSKNCTGNCGKSKPITMFTKTSSQSDGFNPWCQECAKAYRTSKHSSTPAKKGGSVKKTNKPGSAKKMSKKPAKKTTIKKSKTTVPASSKKKARTTKLMFNT
ncbi:MAG: hypothetical protein QQN41_01385 [Nitrosopumilus sp.]